MTAYLLALDFGGTKLTAALAETAVLSATHVQWLEQKRLLSPPDADAQYDLETMVRLSRGLLNGHVPVAVGVSFGGPVDFATGTVRLSHHVPGWEAVPLQQLLTAEFKAPVLVDNDANVAAMGEWRFGAGQGIESLMYITVSTGVGGGWILGGRPYRGHAGMAGEIGHTVVDPNGPVCLCGKRGCVERLASGPYMAGDLAGEQGSRRAEGMTGKDVADRAAQGDKAALKILERGARALGVGIGNAANLLNPQRFILGGGVTKSGAAWWSTVRQTAHQIALPEVQFDIVPAALGDDAPLWGAIALAETAYRA
jgi:glucokinase